MSILTQDGTVRAGVVTKGVVYVGDPGGSTNTDYGSGTLTIERKIPGTDGSSNSHWLTINDTSSGSEVTMSYTTGVKALSFDFQGAPTAVRARLNGSSSPQLRVEIIAHILGS